MSEGLKRRMSQKSSEELRLMLLKPGDYAPAAIQAAEQELQSRGLDPGTDPQPEAVGKEEKQPEAKSQAPVEIDQAKLRRFMQELKDNQNLAMGVLGGVVGAALGAVLWAGITAATHSQIGLVAIVVGFLAGYGVRVAGKGIEASFGVVGAILAVLGCGVGNLLAVCMLIAHDQSIPFFDVLAQLNPGAIAEIMKVTFSPLDLIFYGIAVYTGYKFSFRRITEEELMTLAKQ